MRKYILSILIISIILVAGNSAKAIERSIKPEEKRFLIQLDNISKSDINKYGEKGNKLQAILINVDPISEVENDVNFCFSYCEVYPNTTSDQVEITMPLEKYGFYTIDIYDVLGNKINDVFTGYQSAGLKAIVYNTENLNSRTYFCVITSSNGKLTKSFNVVK